MASPVEYGSCKRCGKTFVRRAGQVGAFCSQRCTKRTRKNQRKHKLRAPGPAETFTVRDLGIRDNWRCHICGKKVPEREYKARDLDPTIDHLLPVSYGGSHTLANTALAHNRCNWQRNNTGPAQLRLIG